MANRKTSNVSSRFSKSTLPSDLQVKIHGVPLKLNKELLIAKSGTISSLMKDHSEEDLIHFFKTLPASPETFELVARFCHGLDTQISIENVIPLSCLAHYLQMTESHSPNNLLTQSLTFIQDRIFPSWNRTIQAFRTTSEQQNILQQSIHLGLVDAFIETIISNVTSNPLLLDNEMGYGASNNTRRKLFVPESELEDLSTLSLQLYKATICTMIQRGIPLEYIAGSIRKYVKKKVFLSGKPGENMAEEKQVIEVIQKLMPNENGLFPCTFLFEMLRFSILLEVSNECRNGLEIRIGKQLDQATVSDLLIPTQGYAKELQYDIDCVLRILKNFYSTYNDSNISSLISVAELTEEFLAEISRDADLKMSTFISLADMAVSASIGTERSSDGIYRAVDIFLDMHRYLTESEVDRVCKVLDCQRMSSEACEHAAKNERMPLRVKVQVLFAVQLQLRDSVLEARDPGDRTEETKEGVVMSEMEKMSSKMMELERDCHRMNKEIESSCQQHKGGRKERPSVWREMKRKFGCMPSTSVGVSNCNCQVKKRVKIHPKSSS